MNLKKLKIMADRLGATSIEYGLIAALISVVIISAVTSVGSNVKNVFNYVGNHVTTASA